MHPAVFLLLAIIAVRVAPWLSGSEAELSGYTPMLGYALCGGVFLPRKIALWFPLLAAVVTHGVVNVLDNRPFIHPEGIVTVVSVVIVTAAGILVRKKASAAVLLGTCLASTVLFYFVSNTVSFFREAGYAKTGAGWVQAVTTGLPAFSPPAWAFLIRGLIGNLLFTAVFYAIFRQTLKQPGTVPAAQPALAA